MSFNLPGPSRILSTMAYYKQSLRNYALVLEYMFRAVISKG